jgi:hypothetical protein
VSLLSSFQQNTNKNDISNNMIVPSDYRFNEGSPPRFQTQMLPATTNILHNQHYQGRTNSDTDGTREMVTSEYPSDEETTERALATITPRTYNQSMGLSGSNTNVTREIEGSGRQVDDEDLDACTADFARLESAEPTAR